MENVELIVSELSQFVVKLNVAAVTLTVANVAVVTLTVANVAAVTLTVANAKTVTKETFLYLRNSSDL
jgi:hypothetical protein